LRANDAIAGVVIILLSAAMIVLTVPFPDLPGQKYGPAFFPRILGAGLIVCGGLLIRRGIMARRAGAPWVEVAPWVREPWRLGAFLLTLSLLLLYIVAADTIGFIPMALAFLLALFFWLGVKPVNALLAAAISTIAIYWFFATLLRVPLPRGLLDSIL
jgi:putative tricarboxylic transport membrane protein